MRLCRFIIILPLLWWGFDAGAQVTQGASSLPPEQWELTLDVIKSRAQTLVIENNGLQAENRQLMEQVQKLQQSINDQQFNNKQLAGYIKERDGRTDQQVRIGELTRIIKIKKEQARIFDGQLGNLQWKKSDMDRKIQQSKYVISDIELHQQAQKEKVPAPPIDEGQPVDNQLVELRKQLEDGNKQEVLLENELGALKTGGKTQNLNVDAIESDNKQLEARLDFLRLRKLQQVNKSSDTLQAQANGRRYNELKRRKDELEADISAYESRLDELRESSLMALSWPVKKKKLVHDMVQTDARNNQLREKIKVLREDIDILRDQVAKLERRVDFVKGK